MRKRVWAWAWMLGAMLSAPLAAQGGVIKPPTGSSGGGATVSDTVRAVTFDSVRAVWLVPTDSILFRGTTSRIRGGAGSMSIIAGTGNNRTLFLDGTSSTGVGRPGIAVADAGIGFSTLNNQRMYIGSTEIYATLPFHVDGTAATPGFAALSDPNSGMYNFGADTLGFATGGAHSLGIRGGATVTLFGGAGNMTIQAGTGASRTLTLQTTTSGSVAKNTLVLGADSSATFLGRVIAADTIRSTQGAYTALAATGAGDVAVCITTGNALTKGATCGSSTAKVKTAITALTPSPATRTLMALRPVSYQYKPGFYDQRAEYGLIAEEAAKTDRKLAFYAGQADPKLGIAKGDPINVNDRAVLAVLIATVQDQQRVIDSLRANSPRSATSLSPEALALLIGAGAVGAGVALRRRRHA